MIDTKELRSAVESAGLNAISGEEVLELLDRLEAAEKSDAESLAMYRRARDERDDLRAKIPNLTISIEYLSNLKKSYEELIGELQDDRDALRAEIEELHALIAAVKKQANAEFYLRVKKEEEYARLRAKIEAMEKQAPAYWGPKHAIEGGSTTVIVSKFPVNPTDAPLYALPGAQTQGEEE